MSGNENEMAMLKSLSIRNYALIDEITVDFEPGLTIITGETGAGKSILIGALSLLTGARADTSVLKDKEQKCIVEGIFDIAKYNLKDFFEKNDLDYQDVTFVRREIMPSGRSRAFVNDTPVAVSLLKELSSYLIDIHSQHDNLLLNNPNYQLDVLDAYADNDRLIGDYRQEYRKWKDLSDKLETLKQQAQKEKAEFDYLQYQFDQLEEARLVEGEQEELEEEQRRLSHTEEIKNALGQITFFLTNEEANAVDFVRQAERAAQDIEEFFPPARDLASRLESAYIELQDIASEAEVLFNDVDYDPERLEAVNQRLDKIYELQHKFGVNSVAQLLEIKNELEQKLLSITSYDSEIAALEKQVEQQHSKVVDLAGELSQRRQGSKTKLEKEIQLLLTQLGMPNAVFEIRIDRTDLTLSGQEKVTFYFSANKKIEPQPLTRVASGGELSRLMLAIKYIVSRSRTLPTIIFDEIDTGVSGEIAAKMGQMIKKIAENIQVIEITHLPQIAAKADNHLLIYKEESEDTTTTRLRVLSETERIREIARMLSGEKITDAAMDHARQLING